MEQSVKCYDKNDKLTTYAEVDKNYGILKYYNLNNRRFVRFYKNLYIENKKRIIEDNSSTIEFDEDCELMLMVLDGESFCRVKKLNCTTIVPPRILSKISIVDDCYCENFTIKPELIQDWLKKL